MQEGINLLKTGKIYLLFLRITFLVTSQNWKKNLQKILKTNSMDQAASVVPTIKEASEVIMEVWEVEILEAIWEV